VKARPKLIGLETPRVGLLLARTEGALKALLFLSEQQAGLDVIASELKMDSDDLAGLVTEMRDCGLLAIADDILKLSPDGCELVCKLLRSAGEIHRDHGRLSTEGR
jgi:hypothetical protein